MEYRVEDLPQFGVILVSPSAPEFAALLADIQKRIENPVAGSPPVPPSSRKEVKGTAWMLTLRVDDNSLQLRCGIDHRASRLMHRSKGIHIESH